MFRFLFSLTWISFWAFAFCEIAVALTINTLFVPTGQIINGIGRAEQPTSVTVGGGNLQSVVRAAADTWEALILDDHTLTLNFGWAPTDKASTTAFHQGLHATGSPMREVLGSLAFNSQYTGTAPLFLDATPRRHEEFAFARQEFTSFGGPSIETRRDLTAVFPHVANSRDVYTIALHEIGHALGLVGFDFFTEEGLDGDIDVQFDSFDGNSIPLSGSHLNLSGPLMSNVGKPSGTRSEISQVDLLAVCQLSQFRSCDTKLRPANEPGDFNRDGDVAGDDFLDWQRGQSPQPLSAVDRDDWQAGLLETPSIGLAGDFNEDRKVDGEDFLRWQRGNSPMPLTAADLANWRLSYFLPSSAGLAGDFDNNGDTNGADLLAWQRGQSPTSTSVADLANWRAGFEARDFVPLSGDFNIDGKVDGQDFLHWQRGRSPNPLGDNDLALWRAHFAPSSIGSVITSVPEPTCLALTVVAWTIGFATKRPAARRSH